MLYCPPVNTIDFNAVGRKVRKTAIRLISFVKVNSHFKVALLIPSTSMMPVVVGRQKIGPQKSTFYSVYTSSIYAGKA